MGFIWLEKTPTSISGDYRNKYSREKIIIAMIISMWEKGDAGAD